MDIENEVNEQIQALSNQLFSVYEKRETHKNEIEFHQLEVSNCEKTISNIRTNIQAKNELLQGILIRQQENNQKEEIPDGSGSNTDEIEGGASSNQDVPDGGETN